MELIVLITILCLLLAFFDEFGPAIQKFALFDLERPSANTSTDKNHEDGLRERTEQRYVLVGTILRNSSRIVKFILFVISVMYRYEPVIVFSDVFDFTPFGALMRFPSGIDRAISVPFWIFVNSLMARTLISRPKSSAPSASDLFA